jgi:hypothetical protein
MIDTICLLIPKHKLYFLSGVSSWDLYSKTDQYSKFVRNPTKAEKETGKYFPRLTGYSRRFGQEANVRLEFSAPKLLYLNNLDELEDKDFPAIIEALQERLKDMGVVASKSLLENASVSSVHFSKNILLEDGYTVNYLISEMNKADLRKSFDFAKTRYMNDGQSLYAHTTSHQMVIYDKMADLNKDKKRAIDKDQTLYQKTLFTELVGKTRKNELQEIIRFEIRLSHKQKMNKVLEGLGYNKNPTFKEVFNSNVSQKILVEYWTKLIKERNLGLFSISLSHKEILQNLVLSDKEIGIRKAIYLLGLFVLSRDGNGMRELRNIVTKKAHDRTWYRLAKDVREASELITKNKLRSWVTQIDKGLEDFKPYKHNK